MGPISPEKLYAEKDVFPALFDFRVENPVPTKATMYLDAVNNNPGWDFALSETNFVMETTDCARTIRATATPGTSVPDGAEALFFVTARARPWGKEELIEVGGVALKAVHEYPRMQTITPPTAGPGNIIRPDLGNLFR